MIHTGRECESIVRWFIANHRLDEGDYLLNEMTRLLFYCNCHSHLFICVNICPVLRYVYVAYEQLKRYPVRVRCQYIERYGRWPFLVTESTFYSEIRSLSRNIQYTAKTHFFRG